MAIKNFSVSSKSFPLIFSDGSYHIRYRMNTENKQIASDWSDVYQIFINTDPEKTTAEFILDEQQINLTISPTYDNLAVLIKSDAIKNPLFSNMKYDFYVKWAYSEASPVYDTNWTYVGEKSSSEAYLTVPNNPRAYYVKARIQIATYDKVISNNVKLVESTEGVSTTYVAVTGNIDGGVI
jgi:hypothetical protein